LANQ